MSKKKDVSPFLLIAVICPFLFPQQRRTAGEVKIPFTLYNVSIPSFEPTGQSDREGN